LCEEIAKILRTYVTKLDKKINDDKTTAVECAIISQEQNDVFSARQMVTNKSFYKKVVKYISPQFGFNTTLISIMDNYDSPESFDEIDDITPPEYCVELNGNDNKHNVKKLKNTFSSDDDSDSSSAKKPKKVIKKKSKNITKKKMCSSSSDSNCSGDDTSKKLNEIIRKKKK